MIETTTLIAHRARGESGSVLLYALLVLVLLAGVSLYFRTSTWPVMTDARETRQLAEADALADSARNVLVAQVAALRSPWRADEVATTLNAHRMIRLTGPDNRVAGEIRWNKKVHASEVKIKSGSDKRTETVTLKSKLRFQVTLRDGTHAVRERELTLTREQY